VSIKTLGLSGLDRDEENLFRQLFESVHEPGWALAAESEADVLLIDFDSMYGQMSWLRAQGGSRPIVALTAGARADATLVLKRPVSEKALRDLLRTLGGARVGAAEPVAAPVRTAEVDQPPGLAAEVVSEAPAFAIEVPVEEVMPPRARVLLDFLKPGVLPGPARLRDFDPAIAIDVAAGQYLGGTSLKPLAPHCAHALEDADWEPLTRGEFEALRASLGEPQPLTRLLWVAGMAGFDGQLCPDLNPSMRFKLAKWPPTEREYPRQIRIATALLKGFGTVEEMAASSGAGANEVADYINGFHALGLIEIESAAPSPATPEPPARGGLLGRLRRG